jgi:UDP-galactopyranose mutase
VRKYDYLVVGSGLFGAVCARELTDAGMHCLVVDKRDHIAGNIYTKEMEGIHVHWYGGHIFHTNIQAVWEYANRFAQFDNYVNSPIANYHGELYNLPFNMNTFHQMWGVTTPDEAKAKIAEQVLEAGISEPRNLEEQAISLIGYDIYEKLVKGYTEKQWGRDCKDLPAFIINRLPARFRFDNNYFDDRWQGIPIDGYTSMIEKMLSGIEVQLNTDYLENKEELETAAARIIYTGQIDQYYGYQFGALEWRSLRFETEVFDTDNMQGVAAMNYTDRETPYTRILEHKHFQFGAQPKTVVTREYPADWKPGLEAYYPINDAKNAAVYEKYAALAAKEQTVYFGGRLGHYRYYDMDKAMMAALELATELKRAC